MGTLLRIGNWRVMIYTLDHAPAHVHIVGADGRAKIALNCPNGPVIPIDCRGIDTVSLKRILPFLEKELPRLCQAWRSTHGNY